MVLHIVLIREWKWRAPLLISMLMLMLMWDDEEAKLSFPRCRELGPRAFAQ